LHERLAELYAPILIGVLPTTDDNYTVYAVSDLYREINATLILKVKDGKENLLKSYSEKVQIPENGCIHLNLDVNKFVKEFDKLKFTSRCNSLRMMRLLPKESSISYILNI